MITKTSRVIDPIAYFDEQLEILDNLIYLQNKRIAKIENKKWWGMEVKKLMATKAELQQEIKELKNRLEYAEGEFRDELMERLASLQDANGVHLNPAFETEYRENPIDDIEDDDEYYDDDDDDYDDDDY